MKQISKQKSLITNTKIKALLFASVLVLAYAITNVYHPARVEAAVPMFVNFQGKITNVSNGTNVPDGNYTFEFKLYDAPTGGNLLWTETWDGTPSPQCDQLAVRNGVFNAKLGSCNSLASVDFSGGNIYLTVNFDDGGGFDGEMTPRKQLVASAFAFVANSVVGNGVVQTANQSAAALSIGRTLANPALLVDTNTASSVTGLKVTSAAAGGGTALAVISSATNENLTLNAKGSGTISIGNTSTGNVLFGSSGQLSITSGGALSTSGNISTSGSGTITSAGLLTGSLGLTVSGAAVSLNASSNFDTNINTGSSTGTVTIGNPSSAAVRIGNLTTNGAVYTSGGNGALNVEANLNVIRGGTGAGSFTANGVLFGNGTSALGVTAAGTTGQCLVATTGSAPTWGSCGLTAVAWNDITAPTGNLSLAHGANTTNFTFNGVTTANAFTLSSSSLSSGALLNLAVTGTAALTGQKGLNVSLSGANNTGAQTTYGGYFSNTHTGTSINVGLYATASGGSTNLAARFDGNVLIQPDPTPNGAFIDYSGFADEVFQTFYANDNVQLTFMNESGNTTRFRIFSQDGNQNEIYSTLPNGLLFRTNGTTQPIKFAVNGTEQLRVTNTGIGILTTVNDRALEINSPTGNNLRLTYNDNDGGATNYADLLMSSGGDLTLRASGDDYYMVDSSLGSGVRFGLSDSGNNEAALDIAVYRAGVYTSRLGVNQFGQIYMANSGTSNNVDVVGIGALGGSKLTVGGNLSGAAWGTAGINIQAAAATYTDTSTAASGTATNAVFNSFAVPTLAATNSNVTTTNAATVYVAGAPTAGTNQTITNAYSLWVDDGLTRLDGRLNVNNVIAAGTSVKIARLDQGNDATSASSLTLEYNTNNRLAVTAHTGNLALVQSAGVGSYNGGNSGWTFNNSHTYTTDSIGIGLTAPGSLLHVQQFADSTNTTTPIAFDVNSVGAAGELTASSGIQTFARIAPIINQTSTAGYTALLINATQTATGSGAKLLQDWQVGGVSKVAIDSSGVLTALAGNIGVARSDQGTNRSSASLFAYFGYNSGGTVAFTTGAGYTGTVLPISASALVSASHSSTAINMGQQSIDYTAININNGANQVYHTFDVTSVAVTGANAKLISVRNLGTEVFGIGKDGDIQSDALISGGTQCLQANSAGVISGTGSACGSGGGSQTPWTSDIDADGFDLQDLSNVEFRETTGAPAGTVVAIFRDNAGDLNANVLTGKTFNVQVNGTDEYNFSSTALAMNSNNITGVGTDITGAGALTVASTAGALTLQTNTSGNIVLNSTGGTIELQDATNITGALDVSTTLAVGSGDAFQVNSSGAIAAATGVTSSGTITFSGLGGSGTRCVQVNNSGVLAVAGTGCFSGAWNDITAPTGNLSLAHGANTTNFTFNGVTTANAFTLSSSSLSSGTLLNLAVTGTAAAANTQKVLNISNSGANANSNQTTYGGYFTNTRTGTGSTNVAAYFSASGGTNNYAAIFENGNVGIGTTTPTSKLDVTGNINAGFGGDTTRIVGIGLDGSFTSGKTGVFRFADVFNQIEITYGGTMQGRSYNGWQFFTALGGEVARFGTNANSANSYFNGTLGIGTTIADRQVEINSATGNNLRLTYNDNDGGATNYADLLMSSGGNLTITPSGDNTTINGTLTVPSSITTGAGFTVSSSGVYTGTGLSVLTANSATTGIIDAISATGLTTGRASSVTLGSALTTGGYLNVTGASYATAAGGTGNLINLAFTNASAATSGNTTVNGINIATTLNTSGATGTKATNAINIPAPTYTACTGGTCTWNGVSIANTASTSQITSTALLITGASSGAAGLQLGLDITGITAGSATETAIRIGAGWDNYLDTPTIDITGAGAIVGATGITSATGNITATAGDIVATAGNFRTGATTRISSTGVGTFTSGTTIGSQTFTTNNISDSGALTVNATSGALTLQTTTSGNIVIAPASTGSVQITSGVTTGTGTASGVSIATTTVTSGNITNINQSTSTFSGNMLFANMANGSGSFTGNFADFQVNGTSRFKLGRGTVTTSGSTAVAGILQDLVLTNSTASGFQFGNRLLNTINGTTAGTHVGQFIRMTDNTTLSSGQVVRGLEVQAYSGSNVNGINTGIASFGYTFGVHAVSTGQAGGVAQPAAIFADLDNGSAPTQGNAIRAYSDNLTSANLVSFYHESSSFSGIGLVMNFGNNSGTFSGKFISLQKNGTESFHVNHDGSTFVSFTGTQTSHAVCHATNGQTNNDELVDCTGTPSADFAEIYPVEADVDVGDVVVSGSEMVNTYNVDENGAVNWDDVKGAITKLKKSDFGYQSNLVGVVSDNYADFTSTGYNIREQDNPKSVALSGRVLVKITNENGVIKAGDYLTSSATQPGKAMKATRPGMVIGMALSGDNGSGMAMVFVNTAFHDPGVMLEGDSRIILQRDVATTELITSTQADSAFIIKQQGSGALLQLSGNNIDRLLVANNGSISLNTTPVNNAELILNVKVADTSMFSINARGDIAVSGVIVVRDNTFAGSIATGEDGLAEVTFSYHLGTGKPVVQLTAEAQLPVFAQIIEFKTDADGNYTGFVIKTFDLLSSPVSAIVHYNVTAKQSGYTTFGAVLSVEDSPTDSSGGDGFGLVIDGGEVVGGGGTTDGGSTMEGDAPLAGDQTSSGDGGGSE